MTKAAMTKAAKAYDPQALEQQYAQRWLEEGVYEPDFGYSTSAKTAPSASPAPPAASPTTNRPYYNLMMFPYPSAEGLHVGNMYAFTGADVHGRFRRQQGFNVFEPMGLDGFGIHSENYAIKIGKHPREQAEISQKNFYRQLQMIGNSFAWNERLETYDPEYYRWTQWLFAQMFRHGLAYKGEARVNWCPSCKTVLADEQVEDGLCERCKSEVERREMSSWYFAITKYADRLLENITEYAWSDAHGEQHTGLEWPNKVTTAQQNWIGRKEGLNIDFSLADVAHTPEDASRSATITVWTKFWETIFGATYLVLAPESDLIGQITTPDQQADVDTYVHTALNKSEQERKIAKQKTGVFTGAYAINPATQQKIPVWVADYVLADVGTGAVMGVPAHDTRDFEFAKAYDLPIVQVVSYADTEPEIDALVATGKQAHEAPGKLINSAQFSGQEAWGNGKQAIKDWLISQGKAQAQRTYHLRDWLISRQRYWGPPIPLIHCETCAAQGKGEVRQDLQGNPLAPIPGWYTVPDDQLPIELPHLQDFKPTGDGTSPLDNAAEEWRLTTCPGCGNPQAQRETDVSDTFLDSAWYFLRYPALAHPQKDEHPFPQINTVDTEQSSSRNWFPVDAYIGGAEHAVLHLLYARFTTMFLHDLGMLPQEEPFPFLFGHGLIIKDGAKMSKSRGNIVNPDAYIQKYGADALRTYLMFLGPYDQGGDFRDTGMNGMYRWLNRVWETFQDSLLTQEVPPESTPVIASQLQHTIASNTQEMAQFKFNTCIARLMELVNTWREEGQALSAADALKFLQLLAPFAPFLTEGLYQELRQRYPELDQQNVQTSFSSIHTLLWPSADTSKLIEDRLTIAIQINGKLRGTIEVSAQEAKEEARVVALAQADEAVQRHLAGKAIKKSIFVPGKLVSFVV